MEHGVFDALQKKYLETVLLEIYEGPEEGSKEEGQTKNRKLLECFSFGVSYSVEGASFALATPSGSLGDTSAPTELKASIKQETKSVIRTLIELSAKLRPLPPNRVISMKLLYAPGTPADYEPAYFRKANPDDLAWFESKPERISCGNVTTPFHHVSYVLVILAHTHYDFLTLMSDFQFAQLVQITFPSPRNRVIMIGLITHRNRFSQLKRTTKQRTVATRNRKKPSPLPQIAALPRRLQLLKFEVD